MTGHTRRSALQKIGGTAIGSLAAGTALLNSGVGTAEAEVSPNLYSEYHYETSLSYDVIPRYEYCMGTDVRIEEASNPQTSQYIYYVTVADHCTAKWASSGDHQRNHPHYFASEQMSIDGDNAGDYRFFDDSAHIGAYELTQGPSVPISLDEINAAVGFATGFASVPYGLAATAASYIAGGALSSSDPTREFIEWDYMNETGPKWRCGGWTKFEIYLEPGETTSFDFSTMANMNFGYRLENSDTIYIIAPGE